MGEVGGKVVFKRGELAVGLELFDGLLHLRRTSAEVRRARDHERVVEARTVVEERRFKHIVRLVL